MLQRFRNYFYSYLFPANDTEPLLVAVPLDRGLATYISIDDLRTIPYICDWWHSQTIQQLDRGRLILTHNPYDSSMLPYAYAIYYVAQTEPSTPRNRSLLRTDASRVPWRGDILIVRLDTDGGRIPARRGRPCQLDERDRDVVTAIISGWVPHPFHNLGSAYAPNPARSSWAFSLLHRSLPKDAHHIFNCIL